MKKLLVLLLMTTAIPALGEMRFQETVLLGEAPAVESYEVTDMRIPQVRIPGPGGDVLSLVPFITVIGSCDAQAPASKTVSCTASAGGNSGDLVVALSKGQNGSGTVTPTVTSSQCSTWQPLIPSNSNGSAMSLDTVMFGCIMASSATPAVQAVWTGASASNTEIGVLVLHNSQGWNTTLLDRYLSTVHSTASTSCVWGATNATRNPNDFILASCQTLATAQTWTAPGSYTLQSGAGSNHQGVFTLPVTTNGAQSATATIASAQTTGMVVALQASPNIDCLTSGCAQLTGSSSSTTGSTDFTTVNAVPNGSTVIYYVVHSNWSGSGTTTMTDSFNNIWFPCNTNTGGSTSATMTDIQLDATHGMACFYSPSVIAGTGGLTGNLTGQPVPSDCVSSCTFVGGIIITLSGTFTWDGFSNTTLASSTSGSNNANCGSTTVSHANDLINCFIFDTAVSAMTAGTTPGTFTLDSFSPAIQSNGASESLVWSGSGSVTPTATLAGSGVAYGGMAVYFR